MFPNLQAAVAQEIQLALFGGIGGLLWFIYGVRHGHHKNNKYLIKFSVEVVGASCLGFVTAPLLLSVFEKTPAALRIAGVAVGMNWSELVQLIRSWITELFKGILERVSNASRKKKDE